MPTITRNSGKDHRLFQRICLVRLVINAGECQWIANFSLVKRMT